MRLKSDTIEIVINDKANKVVKECFQSLFFRYQVRLETSMRGSDFYLSLCHLMYYKWWWIIHRFS